MTQEKSHKEIIPGEKVTRKKCHRKKSQGENKVTKRKYPGKKSQGIEGEGIVTCNMPKSFKNYGSTCVYFCLVTI